MKDYYYILGLSPNATLDDVKVAFRKLSKKFHPDHNDGDKYFEEQFKAIREAYETLIDPDKRSDYDAAYGHAPTERSFKSEPQDRTQPKKDTTGQATSAENTGSSANSDSSDSGGKSNGQGSSQNKGEFFHNSNKNSASKKDTEAKRKRRGDVVGYSIIAGLIFISVLTVAVNTNSRPSTTQVASSNYPSTSSRPTSDTTVVRFKMPAPVYDSAQVAAASDSKFKAFIAKGLAIMKKQPRTKYAAFFTIGSRKEEVLRLQGTPTTIDKYPTSEVWSYDLSTITFKRGIVNEYQNLGDNLHVSLRKLLPENQEAGLNGDNISNGGQRNDKFTIGSTEYDVIRVQGTPTGVDVYPFSVVWTYGLSTITFKNGYVVSFSNLEHNLRIRL